MREVIKYEDNDGETWDTKEEAILADLMIVLEGHMNKYAVGINEFNIEEWVDDTKDNPEVMKALILALNINFTQITADQIFEEANKKM